MDWRVIDTGAKDGRWNMDFDLQLLHQAERGEIPATLRFYRWQPATVSLGAVQKPEEEVDTLFCRNAGIGIVHRPSGGGAILHDDEITYSFTAQTTDHPSFGDLLASYYLLVEGLKRGLASLGITAQVRGGSTHSQPERFIPCFALASRHDLVVDGKKIIGSAQRRRKKAFLQHGSIPFSYNPDLIVRVFRHPEGFFDRATSLSEVLGFRPEETMVKNGLIQGLAEVFSALPEEE